MMTPLSKVEGNVNAEMYQNYQNGAVSNQLTTLEGGERVCWGSSESVDE
jgi:hypothetical protein